MLTCIQTLKRFVSTCLEYHLIKTVQNGGAYPISEILYIVNWIVCYVETYFISILTHMQV